MYEARCFSMNVTNCSSPTPASCNWNPRFRRIVRYSTAFRSVVIAHLPAMAKRVYAAHPSPLSRKFWSCRDDDDLKLRRSRLRMHPAVTFPWRAPVETDAHPLQVQQCLRVQADV